MKPDITVIGGGLAGSEAAWQIACRGLDVRLYEMRPAVSTPVHQTSQLGELVCSNSLKSDLPGTAPYLLKQELRNLGSLLLRIADEVKVPAGHALAVDREQFSRRLTEEILSKSHIQLIREEVQELPQEGITIVATPDKKIIAGAVNYLGNLLKIGASFFYPDNVVYLAQSDSCFSRHVSNGA